MIELLAKLIPEKNLISTYLTDLVVRGVSKSPFADWIMAELKPRDFTPLVLKMFERNSNHVEHIF